MDAFFAAVEIRDNPKLRGKPVIVGGTPEGRGVVSTASYEARKYGVHSAMPAATAVKLCPRGIFLRPRMARYSAVSRRMFALLEEYSPLVEPLSIDEAFLDVTGCRPLHRSPRPTPEEAIARELQERVKEVTGGLTCSLGVAPNKFLAKLASDLYKPEGIVVVPECDREEFLAPLSLKRLWGVGPKTAARLNHLGLHRVKDLQEVKTEDLERLLGRELGRHLARLSRGLDDRKVEPGSPAGSVSQERTYGEFIPADDLGRIESELFSLSDGVAYRLRRSGLWGRTVTLKVRDDRFTTRTRSRTLGSPTCLGEEIYAVARSLFDERVDLQGRGVRLLGVGLGGLTPEPWRQLELFADDRWKRADRVARVSDAVREKLGDAAITRGSLVGKRRRPLG